MKKTNDHLIGTKKAFYLNWFALKFIFKFVPIRIFIHWALLFGTTYIYMFIPILMGQVFLDNVLMEKIPDYERLSRNFPSILIFNIIHNWSSYQILIFVIVSLTILKLITSLAVLLAKIISKDIGNRLIHKLRSEACANIINTEYNNRCSSNVGNIVYRLQQDSKSIELIYNDFSGIWNKLVKGILAIYFIWTVSSQLAIICLITIPIVFLFVLYFSKIIRKFSNKEKESDSEIYTKISSVFYLFKEIKISDRNKEEHNDYKSQSKIHLNFRLLEEIFRALLMNTVAFLVHLSLVVCMGFGAVLVWSGVLSIGQWATSFSWIKQSSLLHGIAGRYWIGMQKQLVSINRIKQIIDNNTLNEDALVTLEKESILQIDVKSINFEYEENKKILNNISFCLKKGEITALTGPVGSGKTTLLNCIGKICNKYEGEIEINNKNIREIKTSNIIDYVFQYTQLFSLSIIDNILYGNKNYKIGIKFDKLSEECQSKVIKACDQVGLSSFIDQLESNYDTMIYEQSWNLSAGQKQKIILARIIISDKPIILLDEPTFSLDIRSENNFIKILNKIKKDKIILLVIHKYLGKLKIDKTIELGNGKVISVL